MNNEPHLYRRLYVEKMGKSRVFSYLVSPKMKTEKREKYIEKPIIFYIFI